MQLQNIKSPDDIKNLTYQEITKLIVDIRKFLIKSVAKTGGHLAPSLGVVELSIALHRVFDTPQDKIIWDVGHQGYAHKILTGRLHKFDTLRQKDGLSGFINPKESEYDSFGVGHASTSISAALGFARSFSLLGKENQSIAVIGDGAMGGGMAFEALNDAGSSDTNLLVILNDNDMSISPNVGALSKYLTKIISGKFYSFARANSKNILGRIPKVWEFARKTEEHLKGLIIPGLFFEELGFSYFGPIDGHDYKDLEKVLRNLKNIQGPRLLHIVTKKGKGFKPAEKDPSSFHGVYPFNIRTGERLKKNNNITFTDVFSKWICHMGKKDNKLVTITPAMCEGSGLAAFKKENPDRYFDVGIAEQHAVTLAAGMAISGLKPVVAIYSTFLQRAFDQLIHDTALQNLNVLFAIDRAGVVGADGATHTGVFDVAYMLAIPNMVIMAPANGTELYEMLNTAFDYNHPVAVRYPRDNIPDRLQITDKKIKIGKAKIIRAGEKIAIFCFGTLLDDVTVVAENLNATLVNMRFIKPLDTETIIKICKNHKYIITIEEGCKISGVGAYICQTIQQNKINISILNIGIEDKFCQHGTRLKVLEENKLDKDSIKQQIIDFCQTK
jgi:1-deoxy-D-xylulose-5-phosphate synthase